jgi:hypothetical protein
MLVTAVTLFVIKPAHVAAGIQYDFAPQHGDTLNICCF